MDPEAHEEVPTDTGIPQASPVPWQFGCAIWIGAFAVVLWAMMRMFGPRPIAVDPPE